MSNISLLYDLIDARCQAVLPNHLRLSDPYRLIKNTDSEKRRGYGLKVVDGSNPAILLSCQRLFDQRVSIVLTRLSTAKETDRVSKGSIEKTLLEDLFLLIKDFEGSPHLGNSSVCTDARYESHSGIQFLSADRDDYVSLEATFLFRYVENVET